MKKPITIMTPDTFLRLIIILFLLCIPSSLFCNNGLVIGWHQGTFADWRVAELGITPNTTNKMLSVTTGTSMSGSSGASMEATPGGQVAYCTGWDGGSGSKAWVLPMTTSGLNNLTITFYQRSTNNYNYSTYVNEYGPRDFKVQYSTNGTSWNDVTGASYSLNSDATWKQFNCDLPEACNNQAALYLRWVMYSNTAINGGGIATAAQSYFADFYMYGDDILQTMTDMSLSKTSMLSNQPSGTTVGTFSVTDPNYFDTFTYSLVAGAGSTNNASFSITGTTLKTASILPAGNYSIRVRVSDGTYTLEENYTIRVADYPVVAPSSASDNFYNWITNVQFGTINQSSGMSGVNNAIGYTDYTAEVTNVMRGATIDLTVTAHHISDGYNFWVRVYFDWNRDSDISDPGEGTIILNSSSLTGDVTQTVSISIPADAALGNTLMRVSTDEGGNMALGAADWGEVEDYTINIQAPTISFADGGSFAQPVFIGGNTDQVIGRFKLTGSTAGASLTAASIKLNGTRTGLSNLKLWSSADEAFGGDTQIGSTVAADPGDGNSVTFNSFSNPITTDGVYYFLTGDVAASGGSGTVQGVIEQNSSLTISIGILSGTITNAVLSSGTSVLPVELTSFTASTVSNGVELKWQTATEVNNYGFEVERASLGTTPGQDTWENVGFVAGAGNSNSPKEYSFIDTNPMQGNAQYRLKQIDLDGNYKYYSQIAEVNLSMTDVKKNLIPTEFGLSQNYPNPFNPSTVISYQLPVSGNVTLKVYDMLGNEVSTLVNETKAPGYYNVTFNAGNLSTGVYIYRITAGSFTSTKKLMLMK